MDWPDLGNQAWHLLLAFALALPIGWERETSVRSAGLRTFPLVAVATCGFLLVGLRLFETEEAQARIVYGIITGIGFIGGGAILKHNESVHGMTTAASLWNTGAIGVAVATDQFTIAFMLATINVLVLLMKRWLPDSVRKPES